MPGRPSRGTSTNLRRSRSWRRSTQRSSPNDPRGRPSVLYISYNPSGSALVRSQVLPYLRALAEEADVTLLVFEGATSDPAPPPGELAGIRVHRLRYHKRPRLWAKLYDILTGTVHAIRLVRRHDIALVHARSHVPAAIAALAGALTRRPFIFDMRGFLADEFAEGGLWSRSGLMYRVTRAAERLLLRRSAAVVVLTERSRAHLLAAPDYAPSVRGRTITVVPCCVELQRFRARLVVRAPALVYTGSVGTFYLLEDMLRFFRELVSLDPSFRFTIANRGQHGTIDRAIRGAGLDALVTLTTVPYDEVPRILEGSSAGIVLLTEGTSKIASSPIKAAEYLAAGLPVVVNAVVGDLPAQLERSRTGVVLRGLDPSSLRAGAAQLLALLGEGEVVREHARALASEQYRLNVGVERYRRLYLDLAPRHRTG